MATSSVRFENGNMIIGDVTYHDVEITDMSVDYGNTASITISQPITVRGTSRNNIYYDDDSFGVSWVDSYYQQELERMKIELQSKYGAPDHLFGFKTVNIKPKNNKQAKKHLVDNPEEL
jgi:hypothetical protein